MVNDMRMLPVLVNSNDDLKSSSHKEAHP
jgi:hypothetical protein